ncbi:hypothetical protein GII33_22705 (plasmid) [Gordonia pseudamarae]|jgi:hypothetical protein|uniref:hypothetical protein n=1 Tax=Gordonia pseudamarae TaxID=2831662 RepID=UPI001AF57ACF|nr:hypothetical protein [Gordonia pseudamarae]QHN28906.1 hypothetical protein GII33_22705 [Gordonia pseudamarae]HMT91056.1 hypothetical protein [Dermatophilaceae bacterium]
MSIPEKAVPNRARRNPFAGASVPESPPQTRQATSAARGTEPVATTTTKRADSGDEGVRKPSKRPTKVPTSDILLSLPEDDKQRMINTIAWTIPRTGIKHQQVFIREAIRRYCSALEEQFNSGEPFDDVPS